MSSDLLSQEEVDSLLKGIDDDTLEPPPDAAAVRPYRFDSRVDRARTDLPALAALNERFAVLMRSRLLALVRRTCKMTVSPPRSMAYREFARNLTLPETAAVVSLAPLRGEGVVACEPAFVSAVVDALFGGGRLPRDSEHHAFSRTELQVMQRLLPLALDACRAAWEPVHPLAFEPLATPRGTPPEMLLPGDEPVVALSLHVEIGAVGGAVHVALPQESLDHLKAQLAGRARRPGAADQHASELLRAHVPRIELDVVANFASVTLNLRKLVEMQVGDVLSIEVPASVVARVGESPLLDCSYGVRNGHYALRIEQVRTHERSTGVLHG